MIESQTQSCGNPARNCTLKNGGTNHKFAPGQTLLAIPIKKEYIWDALDPRVKDCEVASPGLFPLAEAENILQLNSGNKDEATESSINTTVRDLRNITFRTLHFLVHASALISVGLNWKRGKPLANVAVLRVLSQHMGSAAGLRCASKPESMLWYLKGCVEADLQAIATILHGLPDDAARFIHAVFHRLLSIDATAIKRAVGLESAESRTAYERWFQTSVIEPVLAMRNNDLQVSSAVVMR